MLKRALTQVRRMHAHSSSHSHQEEEVVPRLFGEAPGRPTYSWEYPSYFIVFGGTILFTIINIYKPEMRIQAWAKDEAEERTRRRNAGLEVEFGHNYFQERLRDEMQEIARKGRGM